VGSRDGVADPQVQVRCLVVDDTRLFLENATSLLEHESWTSSVSRPTAPSDSTRVKLRPDVTLVDIDRATRTGSSSRDN
jgi:7-keto-8-aminopelargonate synthetase-like enzyme